MQLVETVGSLLVMLGFGPGPLFKLWIDASLRELLRFCTILPFEFAPLDNDSQNVCSSESTSARLSHAWSVGAGRRPLVSSFFINQGNYEAWNEKLEWNWIRNLILLSLFRWRAGQQQITVCQSFCPIHFPNQKTVSCAMFGCKYVHLLLRCGHIFLLSLWRGHQSLWCWGIYDVRYAHTVTAETDVIVANSLWKTYRFIFFQAVR